MTEARGKRRHAAAASRVAVAGLSTTTMLGLAGAMAASEPAEPAPVAEIADVEVAGAEPVAAPALEQEHVVVVIRRVPAGGGAQAAPAPQRAGVPVAAPRPAVRKPRPKPRPAAPVARSHGSR